MADKRKEFSQGLNEALPTFFKRDSTEEEARKRKKKENDQQEMGAWETMQSMAGDAAAGAKDMASNPGAVWDTITGKKRK